MVFGFCLVAVGFERRFNPMLALPREDFIAALVAQVPPKAPGTDEIVAANLRGVRPETNRA